MNKSQSAGIWIIVILLVLSLVSMLFTPQQTTNREDISYTQFINKVKANTIKTAAVDKDTSTIIATPTTDEKTEYKVLVPNDNSLYQTLQEHNVDIKVQKQNKS